MKIFPKTEVNSRDSDTSLQPEALATDMLDEFKELLTVWMSR